MWQTSTNRKQPPGRHERESRITRYFRSWLLQDQSLLEGIFDPEVVYSESWGPEYRGLPQVMHWFTEWNSRARVLQWDIKQFLHQGEVSAVEWHFRNRYDNGQEECFDGVSLFEFTSSGRVISVKEFGSRLPHYNPYADGGNPAETSGMWTVPSS